MSVKAVSDLLPDDVQSDTSALHDALAMRPDWNRLSPYVLAQEADSVRLLVALLRASPQAAGNILASNDVGRCHLPFSEVSVRTLGDPDVVTIDADGLVTRTGAGFALLVVEAQGIEAAIPILCPHDGDTPVVIRTDPTTVPCDVSNLSYSSDNCVDLSLYVSVGGEPEHLIVPPYELALTRYVAATDWMDVNASLATMDITAASGLDPRRLCFPYSLGEYDPGDSQMDLNLWLSYLGFAQSDPDLSHLEGRSV